MESTPQQTSIVKSEAPIALSCLAIGRYGIQINTMDDLFRFAKAVVAAGLAPKNLEKPEAVFVAIQMGLEVGISPMAALQYIAVINGKPKFYGSMPLALVRASGLLESIKEYYQGEGDNLTAICITKRRGESEAKTTSFSVKEAKVAGLWGKNTWGSYPGRMLLHRARGFNLDDNFSDVLKGMSAHDAVIDVTSKDVTDYEDVKLVTDPETKNDFASKEATVKTAVKTKTARIEELCKLKSLKIEDAKKVFVAMGFDTIEEATDRFITSCMEHSDQFASKVRSVLEEQPEPAKKA